MRFNFIYAKVPFEDVRVGFGDEWLKVKPTMPLGQMPVLDVTDSSGKTERYTQTCSLIRMTGEWFGLAGETQIQKARIDEAAECIFEVFAAYARGNWEKDEARKAEMIAAFRDNLIPRIFKYLDGAVAGNGGKNIAGTDKVGSTVSLFTFFHFFFPFLSSVSLIWLWLHCWMISILPSFMNGANSKTNIQIWLNSKSQSKAHPRSRLTWRIVRLPHFKPSSSAILLFLDAHDNENKIS